MDPQSPARAFFIPAVVLVSTCALFLGDGAFAVTIDPSDPNILYTGRWDDSNASQPWAQSKGSSIIADFQGTSVGVTMNTASGDYFRIIIDGDAAGSSKIQIPSGSPLTLASGLAGGVHKLEIVKENDQGRVTLLGLELDAGQSLTAPPARPPRRIVFYGDSNLAGYSLESERNQGGNQRIGSYYTYAGITARMFDAEYHNISKSGATINSLETSYDRIDWGFNNTPWNFSLFPADLVVVNIGANDVGTAEATIRSRYHALLDELRANHPSSHIMLYNGYGWDFNEPANYIHEVIAARSDSNMSSAVFPWLFEQFHGCETDHSGMAQYLAEHLNTVLGWTATPTDVVSGYGANGGVANGSFEERAPFGGWGWRYFDDPGVSRVYDPGGAYDGDYYLRLSDGAASHQSNPASDGDPVPVSVWMRGTSNGDEVDITIDFRNQGQGAGTAIPMQAETETKTLTTAWQQYTMTSTAPTDAPNPVYSTRVTFEAAPGDTADIDRVAMFVPEPSAWMQLAAGATLLFGLARRRERAPCSPLLPVFVALAAAATGLGPSAANAQTSTPIQIYGAWHCGDDYCTWNTVRDMVAFDQKNHWMIDAGDGLPSVNLVVLSFVNPLRLLNKTNDAQTVDGVPKGMTQEVVDYFKDRGIRVSLSIGGITYVDDWNDALAQDPVQFGLNAAEVAQRLGVGIEIDYEENQNPDLVGLQAFIDAFRSQLPFDPTGQNHAARLTLDFAAGDRWLIDLATKATTDWLPGPVPVLDYANAMVTARRPNNADTVIGHWQEHVDGKPQYDPPIPPLGPARFTGSLWLAGRSPIPECVDFYNSYQYQTADFVQTVAPNGAGETPGMLGLMFWAAGCQGTRTECTTPPNSCEGGMGVAAREFDIPIPMPPLREVPEPGALLQLACGIGALLGLHRRRVRTNA